MGDLKIGEYYRTKKGLIRKINTIHTPETRGVSWRKSNVLLVNGKHSLKDIENHDEHVINLLKPGDIVEYESMSDGMRVKREIMGVCTSADDYKWGEGYLETWEDACIRLHEIYSIVTKEQFENMEYKIGG